MCTESNFGLIKFTAHTISQRLRTLKKIPPELIPLGKAYLDGFVNDV